MPSRKRHAYSPRKRAVSASRWTFSKRLLLVLAFLVVVGQGSRSGPSPAVEAQACDPLLSNEIVCENALPGDPDWDIGTGAGDPGIQGFATDISVNQGETVHFKIESAAPFRMHIYRLGYYGGDGGRKVAILPDETSAFPIQPQLACMADQNTGLVDCSNWSESASWMVPAEAVSGVYVAKLVREDNGGMSHIHFVVRDDDGQSDLLFQTSDTTWQAYNDYGGNSLYTGASHLGGWRAVAVSYNRPMNTRSVDPRSFFFSGEYPMLRFLEANGYDVSYFTGVDSDRRGAEIREHKAFLSVGHDEYWSGAQRANVEAARDATPPVHLAFFSGNEVFWKTRWENSHRTLVSYKETHANGKIDPAVDGSGNAIWTGTWRDTRFGPHDGGRPENSLTGQLFMVNDGHTTEIQVPAADGQLRFWRNTPNVSTRTTGATTLTNDTLGFEWDEDIDNGSRPAGLIRLSSTTETVPSKLLDNGSNFGSGVATHSLTLHRRSSGALVFGAGTVQWGYGLSAAHDGATGTPSVDMQQATVNLFADMGVQPRTLLTGLTPATASTDTTRPTSVINSPAAGATLTVGTAVVISGTAGDADGVVAAVEVSTDNGLTWRRASGRGSWNISWTPTAEGPAVIRTRATDDSANIEIPAAGITVDVDPVAPPSSTGPFSLFNNGPATGAITEHFDFSPVELGVRFRSDVSGFITGIKFYKLGTNGGTHRGKLYNSAGTLLATTTFVNETANGWQEALFESPIPINANTPYVASYHMVGGQYAYTPAFYGSAEYSNAPLHAYRDETPTGLGNGIYAYGPGAFPTNSFNATNYWVDLVFVTALPPDNTPPTVVEVAPPDLANDVEPTTNVRVTFSESMDPASISASTVVLRDAANNPVATTLTYNTSAKLATLNPNTPLNSSATYSVFVKGGASGVKDVSGNPMAADFQTSFVTKTPLPDPTVGPGGPILVVTHASNHFTKYYAEILRAEGLNQFKLEDISAVTAATLSAHKVVLLGEMPLTSAQVTLLTNWVIGGGKLIAMRPDKQLASLLGLTDLGTTHANEYLLVDTTGGPGQGIVGETIQYHGTADDYGLASGTTSIAELYSDAATPSGRPGVTWRAVGSGVAAAFTYDLARSVLLTRQGNPAWSGQERDGFPPIRADDLFYGNATIAGGSLDANGNPLQDPQPDWVDLEKVAIPQADEQMRLLANMIHHMSPMPVPRFWYFPHGKKAVVVMTGDDHNSGGTAGRFSIFTNDSPAGCSVADWTCIRSTSYIYAGSIDDTAASNFADNGFEISLHLNTGCANFTPSSLRGFFSDQLAGFAATYPSLEAPSTHRIHCLVWSDYSTLPLVSLENGIRLDTSYYYWPSQWVQDRPGFFTGSGIPMRHAKVSGEIIDVYQADTKMTDESGQSFPFTPNQLFTRALGPQGYYGAFTANMHTDSPTSDPAQGILDEALPRGIPIVSAKQMLDWLDGRNGSSFGNLTWDGTTLGFTIVPGPSTRGLEAMVPTTMPGTALKLASVRRNGVALPIIRTETIKGVSYAFVEATTGAYEAVYDGGTGGGPVITGLSATGTPQGTATFTWQTSQPASSRVQYGTSPTSLTSEVQSGALVTNHSLEAAGLVGGMTYYYRVISVNGSGGSSTSPAIGQAPASFVMPAPIVTAANVTATEDAGTAVIALQLSNVSAQDVVVTFATADGTATAGADYTGTAAGSATISAGNTSGVANVPVLADGQDEPDETFTVSFTEASNATVGTPQVTVTVTDDDDAPAISIADVSVTEGNAGVTNVVFTVSLSTPSSLPVSVDFATADDTARAGSDYVASSGDLVIAAGESSGEIVVPVVGELAFEADERFSLTLSNGSNATIADAEAFGTITNDDAAPSLSIGDVTAGEAGGNAAFTVTLSEPSGVDVTVDFATADVTALAGSDYTARTGTATIAAGATTTSITVPVLVDAGDEADETFTVTLSNPQNATIADGSATGTITDDDATPSLAIGNVTVTEGQTGTVTASFTVTLSAASGQPVTVDVATANGTATAGSDYVAGNATLNFAAGQTSKVFEVVVNGDRQDEADETFLVNLSNAVHATIGDDQATGTVTDDDASPVIVDGTASTSEDAAIIIDVLANVSEGDGDTLTIDSVTQGTHGAVAIITNGPDAGKVRYTPNENFHGSDTFTYTVSDGNGNTSSGSVTVTVSSVNDAPTAVADSHATAEDTPLVIAAPGVLGNDTDADEDDLTAVVVAQPGHGTVTLAADGRFTYTPAADFSGSDSFTYRANDGTADSNVATVTITVNGVNDAPVANDDSTSVAEDSAATAIDVLANDTDADDDPRTITAVTQAAHGAVVITGGGTGLTYAPAANYVGTDSFTYTITDGEGGNDTATVSITVTNVNDAPVANDDAATVAEDSGATAIDVRENDTDPDSDTLSISAVTQGAKGAVVITGGGTGLTYAPNANVSGTDSFSYTISDGKGGSDTATVSITVTNVNDAPVANDDAATVAEDSGPTAVDVRGNDTDLDGDTLSISAVTQGAKGAVVITGGTGLSYAPNANFAGTDSFTYTISDGKGGSDTATVSITVTNVNDAPAAVNDAYSTNEDVVLTVLAPGVLSNDTDSDSTTLTAALVTGPSNGTLELNADGSFSYTPNAQFSGSDSFSYRANDGSANSNTATVTITVNAVNDAPSAANDSYTTNEDTVLNVAAPGVLTNDTDGDSTTLTAALVAGPANGTLELNANGSFSYTPNAQFSGGDSFTYRANDGDANSNVATVTLTIANVNDAPVANDDAATVAEDSAATAINVRGNDTDPDGDTLSISAVTQGANGAVVITGGGTGLTYAPAANYVGPDSFSYTISDGKGGSDTATVSITVTNVNDAPAAANDAYSTNEDGELNVAAPGVLANDTDSDSATLTAALVAGPSSGTLTLNPNGSFSYTPNAQFSGSDSFTYRANDGSANSNTATVTITVNGVNDAPVANDDAATVAEDSAATAIDVRGNDTDLDGDTLSISAVTQGAHGAVVITGGGTGLTYAPAANYVGADSFSYTISDGKGGSDTATVSITVTNVNDAPVAANDPYSTNEDVVLTVLAPGVLSNDTDSDSTTLTAALVAGPSSGTLELNADGSFSYTPNAQFSGSDSFTYRANDGSANSNTATVTITVNNVNDAPVANDDAASVAEDSGANVINVLTNDTDGDGDTRTITAVTQGTNGAVVVTGGGTGLTYAPNPGYVGADSFTYTISDGNGGSDSATVSITVTNVNDAPVAANNSYSTNQGVVLNVAAPGVLGNDTDVDNASLTAVLVAGPSHGTLTLNPNGSLSYTPAAGYSGADNFTYRASDGSATSNVATVSITVIAVNQLPVAVNDTYNTNEDVVLNVAAAGVLANDTDANSNPLTAALVTAPTKGTLTLNPNGSFTYTPNANVNGSDSFTYRANDGTGNSNNATVTITIAAVNDTPVVVDDSVTVFQNSAATAVNVLANDSNVETGETLTITAVTQGAHGTVTMSSTSVQYTPATSYTGADSFTYTVSDGNGGSATGTVDVTVQARPTITINDASVVEGNSGTKDATVTVSLSQAVIAPVTVRYATANGIARSGSDYIATSGTLTFAAGETSKPVVVKVIGENTKERDETFAVSLSLPTNATIARTSGFVTIIDDDSTPTATLNGSKTSEGGSSSTSTLSSGSTLSGSSVGTMSLMSASLADSTSLGDATAVELPGNKVAVFTITLTNPSEIPIAVDFRTVDGTGIAGEDYIAMSGTLTFSEDETVKTIEVPIRPDVKHEVDEALSIELSNPVELLLGNSAAAAVILDDDPAPIVDVTDIVVVEGTDGASQAVFTVTLASMSGKPEAVKFSTSNGTATAGVDYVPVSGDLIFPAGVTVQQVAVPVAPDRDQEGDETFFLNLAQASDAPLAKLRAVGTIVNDDRSAVPVEWTTSTASDFGTGTVDTGALVLASPDGEGDLMLASSVRAEFTGTALPTGWSTSLKKGGSAKVAGGLLTIDFATVNNTTIYTVGRSVEFMATFSGAVNQIAGFTSAQFVVKTDGALWARSATSPISETKVLDNYFAAPHRYRITWTTGRMLYEIDGRVVADHVWGSLPTQMPLQFADLTAVGGGSLVLDWVRVTPYVSAGSYTSKVYDAGAAVKWTGAQATGTMPAGTSVLVSVRTGNVATPDGSWSAFVPADASGVLSASGRFAQYRVELKTTTTSATPVVQQVVVTHEQP